MLKEKVFKGVCLLALMFATSTAITSCGGGLPNGRYVPADPSFAAMYSAIIIDGDNFAVEMAGISAISAKYKYKNGKLIIEGGAASATTPCEFRNDTLYYVGIPFVKKANH